MDGKLDKWQEPAKAKQSKVLPQPDMEPKKRRGGRRFRKMKERYGMTGAPQLLRAQGQMQHLRWRWVYWGCCVLSRRGGSAQCHVEDPHGMTAVSVQLALGVQSQGLGCVGRQGQGQLPVDAFFLSSTDLQSRRCWSDTLG